MYQLGCLSSGYPVPLGITWAQSTYERLSAFTGNKDVGNYEFDAYGTPNASFIGFFSDGRY